jgi:hypothetical protein
MDAQPSIQLLTTQLVSSQARLEGLIKTIRANSNEKNIEKIFVLAEGLDPNVKTKLESSYPKLRLLPCNERPDFSTLIQAAIDHGNPDAITIICNSDIWFDLERSDTFSLARAFEENSDLAFTLTRRQDHQPEQLLSVDGVLPEFLSSDAWIFSGLPRTFPCSGICLGIQDMERLVNATLQLEGYALANAGCWLRGMHMETSANSYKSYNHDWLQKTVLANPVLARHGLPEAKLILPPCHGHLSMWDRIDQNRFTPLWTDFTQHWILADLCQASFAESEYALLWLLFLTINQKRYLMAYVDEKTDAEIIRLLDRCHRLTGRSLCIQGYSMDTLMREPPPGDLCWVSSPDVIGPELLKHSVPIICVSCTGRRPIKPSWISHFHNSDGLRDQLQDLHPIDPEGVARLGRICTECTDNTLQHWFTAFREYSSIIRAYAIALLIRSLEAQQGKLSKYKRLSSLSHRPGYILQLKGELEPFFLLVLKRWMRVLLKTIG